MSGSSADWVALDVALEGRDYTPGANGPAGTMYSVDLRPVTTMATGAIDLKFRVVSERGTTEWVLEPPFVRAPKARRRAVR